MNWTEASPSVFTRDLGGVEKIYRLVSQSFQATGREHWGLYCECTFELDPLQPNDATAAALRSAWIALRHELPGLAVAPGGLDKATYTLPTASSVDAWADATFFVNAAPTPPLNAVVADYPLRDLPALHYFPSSSQLLFLASHWRVDGLGTCMVLDRLFALLATNTPPPPSAWPNDLAKISPSIEDAVGAPPAAEAAADPATASFAREHIAKHHRNAVHAGGLATLGTPATPPGRTACAALTLSRTSTEALAAACKARAVSVTAAAHAALAETAFRLSPAPKPERYAAVMSVNMRPRLQPAFRGAEHAVQTYVTGVTPSVGRDATFGERAAHLTAFYKEGWYSERFVRAMRLATQYHFEAMAAARGAAPQGVKPKPPSNVLLSSLGVVDKYLAPRHAGGDRAVRVTGFRFGVSMLTRQMLLYVWTFDGRLQLSVNYNEAYHGRAEAEAFLQTMKTVLETELGVGLDLDLD
ncbi:hypothetical protein B0T26DRAFT_782641 [Lasiosphaeria miniovina]|uniref:Phthiocerol/phthiodiolone dimycocerosyl transferase C-terminal domain-containing protein n=1 Tax=Lasiosphaeria miniovina TaxID=1954250 RepID=A0AA40ACW0_9PEZI|nr:uncharacterized protein B0T26DRAFT_782641 [Lasiosphaeria miniovina]KAK0713562.1 hypothetical protein B0T26DRAFT_782641 [Lasiosphaeria miniovina]